MSSQRPEMCLLNAAVKSQGLDIKLCTLVIDGMKLTHGDVNSFPMASP